MHNHVRQSDGFAKRCGGGRPARGLILPVVLVILVLLALLSASFSFQVQADYSAGRGMAERLQSRLAAEAGVHAVMVRLRTDFDNLDAWYRNPQAFDQALVWAPDAAVDELGTSTLVREDDSGDAPEMSAYALRFSIVSDEPLDIEDRLEDGRIRFGITDEASKLNINTARPEQLLALFQPVVVNLGFEVTYAQDLVDALIDWRDPDDDPTNEERPAESNYYRSLRPPYRAKNGPFETVEELLMVRGFDGRILFGEDQDRNGLITERSEDDGEEVFPMDNGDGVLERGIYPYVTCYSQEFNVSSANQQRVNLFRAQADDLTEIFERQVVIDFILKSTKPSGTQATRSLADYLQPRIIDDSTVPSPLTPDEATILFDRCTLNSTPQNVGLVNVNTADPVVLRALGLSESTVANIVSSRQTIPAAQRTTPAWLVTNGVMKPDAFAAVQNFLTARSRQFTIESIGYSDQRGIYTRLQVVVAMRGPVPQIVYYRDITRLGMGFPVRGEEGERRFALHAEQ
jgi:type II secretory pathway component PulK